MMHGTSRYKSSIYAKQNILQLNCTILQHQKIDKKIHFRIKESIEYFTSEGTFPLFRTATLRILFVSVTQMQLPPVHTTSFHYKIMLHQCKIDTFGEMILSTLLSRLHSKTWALVSFLSQWAASQILASGPRLLRTKWAQNMVPDV